MVLLDVILGYNTNGFSSHGLEAALEVIAGLGYGSVGLTIDHHALNPFEAGLSTRVSRCAKLLQGLGLVCVVETGARFLLDPWRKHRPNLMDAEQAARDLRSRFLRDCISIAADLGAPALSLWSGAASEETTEAELDSRLVGELAPLCQEAEDAGLVLAFEPEPGMHIESMADFDRIAQAIVNPAFKLTLDLGHAHLTEASVEGTIRAYAGSIANVHVEGMHRPNHDHRPPWDSGFDVKAALRTLVEIGYQGPATLELSRSSHQAVDIARRSIEFLRARESILGIDPG